MKPISDTYYKTISDISLLTREQENNLAKAVQGKSKAKSAKAINTLVISNLRLVAKIVSNEYSYFKEQEDLMSEGTIGLYRAATKFKPDFGAKFSTYAAWWVHQYIIKYIENSSTIRLSSHAYDVMRKIYKISEQLTIDLGYEPSNEDLSQATGLSSEMISKYTNYKYSMIPIDSPFHCNGGEEGSTLADTLEDTNAVRPDVPAEINNDSKYIMGFMKHLNEREQEVLRDRFGLEGKEPMILEDIGKKFSITRERTRQIQNAALYKLRKKITENSIVHTNTLAYS